MPDETAPELGAEDAATVEAQLGRPSRGAVGVAHRCPCGRPTVVATRPRLPGGTPFPTTYYLTCPRAASACSTLESNGVMAAMTTRLHAEPGLAPAYAAAHDAYLADRRAIGEQTGDGDVGEIAGVSAGGMPDRVKCLHALLAHALAAGPGVNPLGDETLALVGEWWHRPCLPGATDQQGEGQQGESEGDA
ncbi:DUF501 domain-containing protein [Microlunatus flavus]|uniref:DUF501 domain-containing protein n=1 Tax=Microlunatus flavus TaxID=1036181 RepID=A0A1H9K592_9ACTN|nr:DUF501 domain-containing protein [Microlunatus flavus]SEQ94396.1 hypothetical protein SAMN05421756_10774 [Microlunatus flavus]